MTGKGITVVVSPLLALIWDQVRALKELGVECEVSLLAGIALTWQMLTGSVSTGAQNTIFRRIEGTERGKELKVSAKRAVQLTLCRWYTSP